MHIEILGSGGAVTTPRPLCQCRVCAQARERGVPYSRSGPSLFVHGPNLLIDTPEETKDQLNRSRVTTIDAATYSHWHPDHVAGRRVFETVNLDWRRFPPSARQTPVYLPQQVAVDFRQWLSSWDQFAFMQSRGWVRVVELADGDSFTLGEYQVTPFRLAADYVYAFIIEGAGRRVLIAMDELVGWTPPASLGRLDLAVLPMGLHEFHPLTGERIIPETHPLLKVEATFAQTLAMVKPLDAARVVMTHIEESFPLDYDDYLTLAGQLQAQGLNITFAYDTLMVEV